VVLALADADMFTSEEIAGQTVAKVQEVISVSDGANKFGKAIHEISTKLEAEKHQGQVPSTLGELKELKIDETVAGLLVNHVFGSSELVVGLNTRKLMVALDLFDWEESGAEQRVEVKMVKVPPNYIKASLNTWLPKGEKGNFQQLMEPLATAIGENKVGFWGSLKRTLTNSFAPKDKDLLLKLAEKIVQIHKSTRCGAAKKLILCT